MRPPLPQGYFTKKNVIRRFPDVTFQDVPQHVSISHLVAATAGLGPNVNVHSGKGASTEEVELISGLSTEFVILFNQLLKRALGNQGRLSKVYS